MQKIFQEKKLRKKSALACTCIMSSKECVNQQKTLEYSQENYNTLINPPFYSCATVTL